MRLGRPPALGEVQRGPRGTRRVTRERAVTLLSHFQPPQQLCRSPLWCPKLANADSRPSGHPSSGCPATSARPHYSSPASPPWHCYQQPSSAELCDPGSADAHGQVPGRARLGHAQTLQQLRLPVRGLTSLTQHTLSPLAGPKAGRAWPSAPSSGARLPPALTQAVSRREHRP